MWVVGLHTGGWVPFSSLVGAQQILDVPGLGTQQQKLAVVRGAANFGYQVVGPTAYGVVDFYADGRAVSLEEKPERLRIKYAIPRLYLYDQQVVEIARGLKPSARDQLEITEVNRRYLEMGQLQVSLLARGTAGLDTGTFESLNDASNYIRTVDARQGQKISAPEEIACR